MSYEEKISCIRRIVYAIRSAYADEKDLVETASSISTKSSGEISKDSVYWKFPGAVGLNANQAYFNDYCTDGSGASVSLDAFVNLNANYQKKRVLTVRLQPARRSTSQ